MMRITLRSHRHGVARMCDWLIAHRGIAGRAEEVSWWRPNERILWLYLQSSAWPKKVCVRVEGEDVGAGVSDMSGWSCTSTHPDILQLDTDIRSRDVWAYSNASRSIPRIAQILRSFDAGAPINIYPVYGRWARL